MTPAQLLDASRAALAASREYSGKPILLIQGHVQSSESTSSGPLVRIGDFEGNAIDCYFRSAEEAATLKLKHVVNVIGVCRGVNRQRTVDLVDCAVAIDLLKYRPTPAALRERFDAQPPDFTVGAPRFSSGTAKEAHQKGLVVNVGRILEVHGVFSVPQDRTDPAIVAGDLLCHFNPTMLDALSAMKAGWPVRVRGTARLGKDNRIHLHDCGLCTKQ
jgi:hypothetical protein